MNKSHQNPIEVVLSNGIRTIFIPMPWAQTTTVLALVKAGPRFDPNNKGGLSHIVEHLKIKSISRRNSELLNDVELYTSRPNAFTYFETNKYWITLVPQKILSGINLLNKVLISSNFTNNEIDQERRSITEEANLIQTNPQKRVWELWTNHIFQDSDLGKSYLGNETISSISSKDIDLFCKENYTLSRIVFLIAGNLPKYMQERIKLVIERDLQLNPASKNIVPVTKGSQKTSHSQIKIYPGTKENLVVVLGFQAPSAMDKKQYALRLIQDYLCGSVQSPLWQRLVIPGFIYFIQPRIVNLSDAGYFALHFNCRTKNLNNILEIIYTELRNIKKGNISQSGLSWAKKYYINQQQLNLETTIQQVMFYSSQYPFESHQIIGPRKIHSILKNISSKEVQKIAREFFIAEKLHISIIGNIDRKIVNVNF